MTSSRSFFYQNLPEHIIVGIIRDGEHVRRHFSSSLVGIAADNMWIIDGEPLVWIHSDTEETRIGVNQK